MKAHYNYYVVHVYRYKVSVIIYDEKIYAVKFCIIVLSYLNFTTFVIAFVDIKRHEFLHTVKHVFSYIRFYFAKADENFWREGQKSKRTDF